MGILDNLLGSNKKRQSFITWIPLTNLEQLEEIKEQSKTESVFIFKHSTRCGISSMVIKRFEALFTEEYKNLKVYYLDLLTYRNISNEVGYTFKVIHQSPQLLVIKNGISVHAASHYDITIIKLSIFI